MKRAAGITYKQREIVLVPFPYSDLSASKKRPVLIVSNDTYNQRSDDVLVCVITSNKYTNAYSVDLTDKHLETGILPEPSVVKTHKLFSVHKSKIIKKFSVVKTGFYQQVEKMIYRLVQLPK
ncbi:MAG: type II toxin-antitoxin system PemK/MazF family toxin [Bacteroidales bacterium]